MNRRIIILTVFISLIISCSFGFQVKAAEDSSDSQTSLSDRDTGSESNKVWDHLSASIQPGDFVRFGDYYEETIEWLVLEVNEGKALMISRYAIDAEDYESFDYNATWETCWLRHWLNGKFYESAFNTEEKLSIQLTKIRNNDNPEYGTAGGNDTEDKVFLLSIEEAETYWDSDEERVCYPTQHAIDARCKISEIGSCSWWLRSPGDYYWKAAFVRVSGKIEMRGYFKQISGLDYKPYGFVSVRPAIWVSLDNEEAYPEEIKSIDFRWSNGAEATIDINWSWEYFAHSATEYNHNLAMASLALSQRIHTEETFQDLLENTFGFKDVYYVWESTSTRPGFALAHKHLTLDGQDKQIVLVVIRGTNLNQDLDDLISDLRSQSDGFRPSTESINLLLKKYIETLGCDKSNTILYITGHSLGGAVAQSLAPFAENYTLTDDNCFIYTFAAANAFIGAFHSRPFKNVHNIINSRDAVPKLPLIYGKYGHEWFYDSADLKYRDYYAAVYKEEGWHCQNIVDEHDPATYFAFLLCDTPDNMGDGAENPYTLTSIHCPVDICVYDQDGELMAQTSGEEVHHKEETKVLVITDGENKEILAPPGVNFSIEIIGTGDGVMNVACKKIDPYTDEVIEEKQFDEVTVNKETVFDLQIDERSINEIELIKKTRQNEIEETSTSQTSPALMETVIVEMVEHQNGIPWAVVIIAALLAAGGILCSVIVLLKRNSNHE